MIPQKTHLKKQVIDQGKKIYSYYIHVYSVFPSRALIHKTPHPPFQATEQDFHSSPPKTKTL
jgi:hypothetical protein